MAGGGGKAPEEMPTWAVAVVCFVLIAVSIVIEYIIHLIRNIIELMLLGFISLLLTVLQGLICDICIPASVGATWHPCSKKEEERKVGNVETLGIVVRRYKQPPETKVFCLMLDPERFRFARETLFGRRHLSFGQRRPFFF